MRRSEALSRIVAVASAALLGVIPGCARGVRPIGSGIQYRNTVATAPAIRGHAGFAPQGQERVQSTMSEIASGSIVTLSDPTTGNALASSLTDGSGNFVLTFANFTPASGAAYVLEATHGLSVGGATDRVGTVATRIRTLLFWDAAGNGWQSLTNSTVNTGIVVSPSTTAIGAIVSLKAQAGSPLTLSNLIDTVNGTTGVFSDTGTGLSDTTDFLPVLADVNSAIALDQDPVADISYDSTTLAYRLATGVPLAISVAPAIATQGGVISISGTYFDPDPGRNTFWFGSIPAATWSVSADREQATVSVPANAYDAPLRLEQPGAVVQVLLPLLPIHGTVGTLAGTGYRADVDGSGTSASFNAPWSSAFDLAGNQYVVDYLSNSIREIAPNGLVSTFAGGAQGSADGTGTAAQFYNPMYIAADGSGNLYVADQLNNRVRKITSAGGVSTLAGSSQGYADGVGSAAQFYHIYGIAVDEVGNVYAADPGNFRLRKITPNGVVSTLAGGTQGTADGTGAAAQFGNLYGLAVDPGGDVYVADAYNNRIRKVTPAGVVTTVAGSGPSGVCVGSAIDGTGTAATFNYPEGIALDSTGDLYIADSCNDKIRKMTSAGVVTTVAGSGTQGWDDGPVGVAKFYGPSGVTVDALGNVWVCDAGNNRIRVVTP